ncbi:MAG: adenosine kinase, partial [Pseudomonadota bacterium]
MSEKQDVVAIGNALVDVVAKVEDGFLADQGVEKGVMTLIDDTRAVSLYAAMPPAQEISGGSGANTAAGLAAIGIGTGYIGKVKDDQLGRIFSHDIRAIGVGFGGPMLGADQQGETGRSLILVSPDGERSMNTALGVSVTLTAADIDQAMIADAEWLYLEGYLFDTDAAKAAYAKAIATVKGAGGRVSFTVSDPFCVDRHREDMRRMIREDVDLLFANQAELLSLYQTDSFELALGSVAREVGCAAITLGADGAVVVRGGARVQVPPPATEVVDTTGAGDLFASGFLAGQVRGRSDEVSAHMGCLAAAEIISHLGARPEADLADLMAR